MEEGKYDITTTEVSLLIRIPIAYISRISITGCTEQLDKSRAQTPFPDLKGIWARDYSGAGERRGTRSIMCVMHAVKVAQLKVPY